MRRLRSRWKALCFENEYCIPWIWGIASSNLIQIHFHQIQFKSISNPFAPVILWIGLGSWVRLGDCASRCRSSGRLSRSALPTPAGSSVAGGEGATSQAGSGNGLERHSYTLFWRAERAGSTRVTLPAQSPQKHPPPDACGRMPARKVRSWSLRKTHSSNCSALCDSTNRRGADKAKTRFPARCTQLLVDYNKTNKLIVCTFYIWSTSCFS